MPAHRRPHLLLLLGQAALGALLLACSPAPRSGSAATDTPVPASTATATTPPTASPTASPAPTFAPVPLMIGNTDGDGVYIRRSPETAERVKAWADRTPMIVVGPDREVAGRIWKPVVDPDGNQGWVPTDYLVPAAPSAILTVAQQTAVATDHPASATPSSAPTGSADTPSPTSAPPTTVAIPSGVNVIEQTRLYRIGGLTADDVRDQIRQLGPASAGGRFAARTAWTVRWSYRLASRPDACSIVSVDATVDVVFTMPHWDPAEPTAPGLRDQWNRFYAALQTHEGGHRDLAVQAAGDVLQVIRSLPAASSCDALRDAANAAGEEVLAGYRQREAEYDDATNHGETQGARW